MKEIKFRGYWQGQMLEVMQIDYRMPQTVILTDGTTDNINVPLDKVELMQYTGFNDIEDNAIYKGDIVSFLDTYSTDNGYAESLCIGEVVWDDETASFQVTERLSAESYEVFSDCKVIGNIYENYELLNQTN